MRIAVCDDEQEQCSYIERLLCTYGEKRECSVEVKTFNSAESFLFGYERHQFDVLLLDIQMGGISGMELAREIRKSNDAVGIVFVTAVSELAAQGYDVSALHYLLKPIVPEKLYACLDRVRAEIENSEEHFLLVQSDGSALRIAESDIRYAEAVSRGTAVHTTSKKHMSPEHFGSFSVKFSDSFVRCHRSYCVNLRFVERISKYELTLDNGELIPVSRRLYSDVNEAFIRFYRGQGI